MENQTKQQLAEQLSEALILKTRDNGEAFYCLKDDAPAWMTDCIRECHDNGDELPNDWRYQFIRDAANTLAYSDNWDDLDYPESDIYHHELIKWLGEFPNAPYYCDTAADELGFSENSGTIMDRISLGQAYAKQETLGALQSSLENLTSEAEAA